MIGNGLRRPGHVAVYVMSLALLGACAIDGKLPPNDPRVLQANRAMAMFQERCRTAGMKISRTVSEVEGVVLMKLRPARNVDTLDAIDPYGSDLDGDGYIETFVSGAYDRMRSSQPGSPRRFGYGKVEAVDPKDGIRYSYVGGIKEVEHVSSPLIGGSGRTFVTRDFVLSRTPVNASTLRYGVTYDDISTAEERAHWIAGSSLRVVDLQTNEVIAERIGYMVDPGQGITAGGRSPWLIAADHACPSFHRFVTDEKSRGASLQPWQTFDFVEKVLTPKR